MLVCIIISISACYISIGVVDSGIDRSVFLVYFFVPVEGFTFLSP